jgi:hypothetical protein
VVWFLAVWTFVGYAVLYVGVGVALLRFWNWADDKLISEGEGETDRRYRTLAILSWPVSLVLVAPFCYVANALQRRGDPLRAAWTWVLRLAGCRVPD